MGPWLGLLIRRTDILQNQNEHIEIVLIHGWGMNQGIWSRFADLLSQRVNSKVHCIDLPGYGTQFDTVPASYDLQGVVDAVHAQLPARCIVLGWSLGGLITQALVAKADSKVVAHIQLCSSPKFVEHEAWPGIKPAVLKMFAKQLTQNHESVLTRFLAIQCMGLDSPNQTVKTMLGMLKAHPLSSPSVLNSSLDLLSSVDLREQLKRFDAVACLRVFGRLDSLVPAKVVPQIQELNPSCEVHIMPKASHAPFISHESDTLELLSDFIRRHNFTA